MEADILRILGIDPGFAITGYSIIDYIGNKFNLITSGAVLTQAGESFPLRLLKLNNDLEHTSLMRYLLRNCFLIIMLKQL